MAAIDTNVPDNTCHFKTILITGGAGFVGSAVARHLLKTTDAHIVNIDALTYAANPMTIKELDLYSQHHFVHANICDKTALESILTEHTPDLVLHLAAESHVDRSIDEPGTFVDTNVVGTYALLEIATAYLQKLSGPTREQFRFIHVSTDEVYGALEPEGLFSEESPYRPTSPYAATKAASDHLVRAWTATYGLPTIVTNSSNNYGPYQFPEKLIPRTIARALRGDTIEVYGSGHNVRDWIHVEDHAAALWRIANQGRIGQTYNIGTRTELSNINLIHMLCEILDGLVPARAPHDRLITYVEDRPGHDFRYALDNSRLTTELNWRPSVKLADGLQRTVEWYVGNREWWEAILSQRYRGERLGLTSK